MKTYVLTNEAEGPLEYDYSGNTYRLEVGETRMSDFNHAHHAAGKLYVRGVTLREE